LINLISFCIDFILFLLIFGNYTLKGENSEQKVMKFDEI